MNTSNITKAMILKNKIVNDINAGTLQPNKMHYDRVMDVLTVLDVYEPDILDTSLGYKVYNNCDTKYNDILEHIENNIYSDNPIYNVIIKTVNNNYYSYSVLYNNYVINDINSILDLLRNESIEKIIKDDNKFDDTVTSVLTFKDYNVVKSVIKNTVTDALNENNGVFDYYSRDDELDELGDKHLPVTFYHSDSGRIMLNSKECLEEEEMFNKFVSLLKDMNLYPDEGECFDIDSLNTEVRRVMLRVFENHEKLMIELNILKERD